jgi:hypothetical protein
MHKVLLFVMAMAAGFGAAFAQDAYPDIRGTWTGIGADIALNSDSTHPVLSSLPITQVITEQTDRRFAGTMTIGAGGDQSTISFVGVLIDASHFLWSEPNGFVDGRLIDRDTIESCYVRVSSYSQDAACQTLTREE